MDILTDGGREIEVNGRIYSGKDAERLIRHFRNEKKRQLGAEAVENATGTRQLIDGLWQSPAEAEQRRERAREENTGQEKASPDRKEY